MGLRQLVWALIAALLIYGGWQFVRALLAARKATAPPGPATQTGRTQPDEDIEGDEAGNDEFDDAGFNYAPMPASVESETRPKAAPPEGATSPPSAVLGERGDFFALELDLQRLRRELGALRAALDVQQGEIGVLHAEVKRLGEAPAEPVAVPERSVGQDASPEYTEALVLARRGLAVDDISARCGITRAEAELVVSLVASGEAGSA